MKRKITIPAVVLMGTLLMSGASQAQAVSQPEKPAIYAQADLRWKPMHKPFGKPQYSGQNTQITSGAQGVIQQVNAERAKNGLRALKQDTAMTRAANVRAAEIARKFSHTRPNGARGMTALAEAGVSYRAAGENIAMGQTSAQQVMSAWMGSSGHRANILSSRFGRIGVGQAVINGRTYWVQLFAD